MQALRFCKMMLQSWDEEADGETSDEMLSAMEVALRTWRSIAGIITWKPHELGHDEFDCISFVRNKRTSSTPSPDVSVSIAMHESEWYKARMDAICDHRAALVRHKDSLADDMNILSADILPWSAEHANVLIEVCQRFCQYQHDMPPIIYAPLEETAVEYLSKYMGAGLASNDAVRATSVGMLCDLAGEASLAFSLHGNINELCERAQSRQAELMSSSKVEELASLAKAVVIVEKNLLAKGMDDNCKALLKFVQNEQATQLANEQKCIIQQACDHLLAAMAIVPSDDCVGEEPSIMKLLDAIIANMSGDIGPEVALKTAAWHRLFGLRMAIVKWEELADSDNERIVAWPRC